MPAKPADWPTWRTARVGPREFRDSNRRDGRFVGLCGLSWNRRSGWSCSIDQVRLGRAPNLLPQGNAVRSCHPPASTCGKTRIKAAVSLQTAIPRLQPAEKRESKLQYPSKLPSPGFNPRKNASQSCGFPPNRHPPASTRGKTPVGAAVSLQTAIPRLQPAEKRQSKLQKSLQTAIPRLQPAEKRQSKLRFPSKRSPTLDPRGKP